MLNDSLTLGDRVASHATIGVYALGLSDGVVAGNAAIALIHFSDKIIEINYH